MNNLGMFGIEDDKFDRSDVPMTKEEIRVISLSKLKLKEDSCVLDIGSGTGSLTIEAGRICKRGKIYSIEKNYKAFETTGNNIAKFNLKNISLINDKAENVIDNIEVLFDSVFIGGSSGKINELLFKLKSKLKAGARIVINATLFDSFINTINSLEQCGYTNINYCQVQINRSKRLGKGLSFNPLNPVFIIWGEKK